MRSFPPPYELALVLTVYILNTQIQVWFVPCQYFILSLHVTGASSLDVLHVHVIWSLNKTLLLIGIWLRSFNILCIKLVILPLLSKAEFILPKKIGKGIRHPWSIWKVPRISSSHSGVEHIILIDLWLVLLYETFTFINRLLKFR